MRSHPILTATICFALTSPLLGDEPSDAAKKARLKAGSDHMEQLELHLASQGDAVELINRPLLTFGDSARSNENGMLWAWRRSGRPLAVVELYQPTGDPNWIHAITLTSTAKVSLKTPDASKWLPEETQIRPTLIPGAKMPAAKEPQRLRQLKELARRFTAHEFWDPDNSRFELRLLVQPVHRYSDPQSELQDGAIFVLAHGTNPEVLLLIEALGKSLEEARWHYSLARLGSAELHVELDRKEVWKVDRAEGVVGRPSDPYWLFVSPADMASD